MRICVYISLPSFFFPIFSHGSPILAHSSFITCLWSPASYWPRKSRADGFPLFLSPRLWPVPPGSCSQNAPSRPPKKSFNMKNTNLKKNKTNKNLSSFTISFIIGKKSSSFSRFPIQKDKNLHRSLLWPLWPSHPSAMRDEHHAHLVGYRETPRPARQAKSTYEDHLWFVVVVRCSPCWWVAFFLSVLVYLIRDETPFEAEIHILMVWITCSPWFPL